MDIINDLPRHTRAMYRTYYQKCYPHETIYRMLTRNRPTESGERRRIGIQYRSHDVFVPESHPRATPAQFRHTTLLALVQSLHMGLFDARPAELSNPLYAAPHLEEKELVLDIDITDYERFCACRGEKRLCQFCWLHIEGAYLLLDHFLCETMGYPRTNLLWVFSGGKGVHCLVNAPLAMRLSPRERTGLYSMLHIGREDDTKLRDYLLAHRRDSPDFMARVLAHFYERVIRERAPFSLELFERFCLEKVAALYPALHTGLREAWLDGRESKRARLVTSTELVGLSESERKWTILQRMETALPPSVEIRPSVFLAFRLLYPMVDAGPLRMNHLIKLPFSIHPATGNVALPIEGESLLRTDVTRDFLSYRLASAPEARGVLEKSVALLEKWVAQY